MAHPSIERLLAYKRDLPRVVRQPRVGGLVRAPRSDSLTGPAIAVRTAREGYDWGSVLRALSVPTLVFHATEDALPTGVAEELLTLLPQACLTLIPGSGHMPFWEAPETLFPAIESFPPRPNVGSRRSAALTL